MADIPIEFNFSPLQWEVITHAIALCEQLSLRLYGVGGIVRDALLGFAQVPRDLDLVVEGGNAIAVARELHTIYRSVRFVEHPKFQTAELTWDDFTLDLTTARTEVYPYGGANPLVSPASLREDLWRRDFTVNALAVQFYWHFGNLSISPVIDLWGGIEDLGNKQIRSIRAGSFAEDPRRMFRAVRFAVRLGFQLNRATEAEIRAVCDSGVHDVIGGSRLRAELVYILQAGNPRQVGRICRWLADLGAWRCVDPNFQVPDDLEHKLRRLVRWRRWFGQDLDYLLLGMEVLLWAVEKSALVKLDLFPSQLKRMERARNLIADLSKCADVVSEIYDRLSGEDLGTLILAGGITGDRHLWKYLTSWQNVAPLLTGSDLRDLGYPHGKWFGKLLQGIRSATLDGVIKNRQQAIAFAERYWRDACNQE